MNNLVCINWSSAAAIQWQYAQKGIRTSVSRNNGVWNVGIVNNTISIKKEIK